MRATLLCPECGPGVQPPFAVELLPKNDCVYDLACPLGHGFRANILYHEFQKLFEVAVGALASDMYRDAVGSFAASYERFAELCVRVLMNANQVSPPTVEACWKQVSRQSERQLGAFIFLFAREFGKPPELLAGPQVELRNKVVHQGYFPTAQQCVAYGTAVLSSLRSNVAELYSSERHQGELVRAINDQGDFSPTGPRVHYFAHSLVNTNGDPANDTRTIEQMVAAELELRRTREK